MKIYQSTARMQSFAALALAVAAVTANTTANPVTVTLNVEPFRLTGPDSTATFWTRAYNPPSGEGDSLPVGPIIRANAGDTLTVIINNNLGANDPTQATTINTLHAPNTTNVHTHGLHIGSKSPADNVFSDIQPGESYTHVYNLPADHQGGTHWYHAHHHGSTALQAGGGMAGVLIIDDAVGDLPMEVLALPEVVLMLQHIPVGDLHTMAGEAGDDLMTLDYDNRGNDAFILCNGEFQPQITLTQGVNTRLRMVFAAVEASVELSIPEADALGCTWELLAKDGVYVSPAPRAVGDVYLAPGNRADVIIRCDEAGTGSLESIASTRRSRRQGMGPAMGGPGNPGGVGATMAATVATLAVTASTATADTSITAFEPKRPAYLADLTSYDGALETFEVAFAGGANTINGGCNINGVSFQGADSPLAQIPVGAIHEWSITGNGVHPFHLHINPYQLQDVADPSGWFQTGDWHDVTLLPGQVTVGAYRFATDTFTGSQVLHCHFLEHEDRGCMGHVNITGVEGTVTPLLGTALVAAAPTASTASTAPTASTASTAPTAPTATEPSPAPTTSASTRAQICPALALVFAAALLL